MIQFLQNYVRYGLERIELRDELYCQTIRQTHKNPEPESLVKAWSVMCLCSAAFSASKTLHKVSKTMKIFNFYNFFRRKIIIKLKKLFLLYFQVKHFSQSSIIKIEALCKRDYNSRKIQLHYFCCQDQYLQFFLIH